MTSERNARATRLDDNKQLRDSCRDGIIYLPVLVALLRSQERFLNFYSSASLTEYLALPLYVWKRNIAKNFQPVSDERTVEVDTN